MKILAYKMLGPGTTRGAVTDRFYRWTSGQVFNCPEDAPEGEFVHMDPVQCIVITEKPAKAAPEVQTASIDASDTETRPVAAKRRTAKKK